MHMYITVYKNLFLLLLLLFLNLVVNSCSCSSVLKAEIGQLDYHCVKLKASVVEVSTRLYSIQQSLPSPLVCSGILQRKPEKVNNYSRILGARDEVERTMLKATQVCS